MSDSVPRDWIGTPLRSTYATTLDASLPQDIAVLLATIDTKLSLQTFAHDLTSIMPRLRAYARSLTRDLDAADDLVQDTLLKAWKARDQFTPGTSLRAWTSTILRNSFLSQRRRARFDGDYDEQIAETRLACPEAQSAVVELGDVQRAMAELATEQREALSLVAIQGLSYEEAATRAGISVGSLKSRVSRGRSMLQSIINGDVPRDCLPKVPIKPTPPLLPAKQPATRSAWSAAKAAGQPLWIGLSKRNK